MAVPDVASRSVQRILVLPEIGRHVRRGKKPSAEIVRPRVIRTLNPIREMAVGLIADARAAMTADVEQRVHLSRSVAHDDDAFAGERAREVVARVRNLIGAPGADPAIEIETFELTAIEIRVGI